MKWKEERDNSKQLKINILIGVKQKQDKLDEIDKSIYSFKPSILTYEKKQKEVKSENPLNMKIVDQYLQKLKKAQED